MSEETYDLTPGVDLAVDYTVNIVASYVRGNHVAVRELLDLIPLVHKTLVGIAAPASGEPAGVEKATNAQIRRSITREALISFEDGKPYKALRRHLRTLNLTPEAYRTKWGLPADYPMTSPGYSEKRSQLARDLGLGQQRRKLKAVA